FKITEIEPGGVFASLINQEDTITAINGKKITSLNEVMDLLARIKDMNNLSLGVIRDGEVRTLNYSISN
ncbi:PDZ domain-containing protein, partial [Streptococcus suis]|uniref:PDZ domain-containing protein n=1 Tax=Streptococcus suis TaxID=1307 RepID=UPI003CF532DF